MKYIVVTEVDNGTKIPCTVAPQRNGPAMPDVKGLQLDWANMSRWPIKLNAEGVYLEAPKYYGVCDDDADVSVAGVLEVLTEEEWTRHKDAEFNARAELLGKRSE